MCRPDLQRLKCDANNGGRACDPEAKPHMSFSPSGTSKPRRSFSPSRTFSFFFHCIGHILSRCTKFSIWKDSIEKNSYFSKSIIQIIFGLHLRLCNDHIFKIGLQWTIFKIKFKYNNFNLNQKQSFQIHNYFSFEPIIIVLDNKIIFLQEKCSTLKVI